jgi:hypothetical protein
MDADVAVSGIQKILQVGEAELVIRREGADDTESHALVDYLIE